MLCRTRPGSFELYAVSRACKNCNTLRIVARSFDGFELRSNPWRPFSLFELAIGDDSLPVQRCAILCHKHAFSRVQQAFDVVDHALGRLIAAWTG